MTGKSRDRSRAHHALALTLSCWKKSKATLSSSEVAAFVPPSFAAYIDRRQRRLGPEELASAGRNSAE